MPDAPADLPDDVPTDDATTAPADGEGDLATGVVVGRAPARDVVRRSRSRALALRQALPAVVRHPVVVGAGAAAATVAVRVAVEVARRALTGSAGSRPVALEVSGSILHQVTVERRVHVVHEVVHHVVHHHAVDGLPPRAR
ncbi:MAG TPA: hypothetical protein VE781_15170 [Kineosporiaceae bacterium]|jgi:hypothetical protein|nr:hypothetical protein [Kineosporiaceae bacterium]